MNSLSPFLHRFRMAKQKFFANPKAEPKRERNPDNPQQERPSLPPAMRAGGRALRDFFFAFRTLLKWHFFSFSFRADNVTSQAYG